QASPPSLLLSARGRPVDRSWNSDGERGRSSHSGIPRRQDGVALRLGRPPEGRRRVAHATTSKMAKQSDASAQEPAPSRNVGWRSGAELAHLTTRRAYAAKEVRGAAQKQLT